MKKLLYFIPILSSLLLFGQSSDSLWNVTVFRQNAIALDNPLLLETMDSLNIGNSKVSYFFNKNDFRDAYMAKKSEGFNVQSERFVTVKNWKFYGKFSFSKYDDYETNYKDVADPYRDNPYKIADSSTADWRMQHYYLQAKIISPYFNRYMRAGLGVKYEVLNGARQKDPRPLDKTINIELTPSIMFDVNSKFKIGVNGYYNRYVEDLVVSMQNNLQSREIYKLLGLGEYLYNGPIILSSTLSRNYQGNKYGAGLSLGYDINAKNSVNGIFSFKTNSEKVVDGTSIPYNAGEHKYTDIEASILYKIRGDKMWHNVDFYGLFRKTDDTESIQVLNSITQQYEVLTSSKMHWKDVVNLQVKYDGLLRNRLGRLQYNFFGGVALNYFQEKYLSTDSKELISNINAYAGIKRWFYIGNHSVSASYQASYQANLDKEFRYYANANSTNFVANTILYPNYIYNTMSVFGNKLEVQFTFSHFKKSKSQMYLKASYENYQNVSTNQLYKNGLANNYLMFTIGLYN